MRRILVSACLALAMVGCATTPTSPAQTVFAIESGYAAALSVAVAYKKLPDCGITTSKVCSQKPVVEKLQQADIVAYEAIMTAQNLVRTSWFKSADAAIAAANEAVAALVRITSTLRIN